jgi:glycosyltransferase involved in cell wall biosynthesis
MDLSVVVPCYNEAGNLERLFGRFAQVVPADLAVEVVFVDNGSTDGSRDALPALLARHRFARGVTVPVNRGYGHGILQGLNASTGAVVGWTHADLQTDPVDVVDCYRAFRDVLRAGTVVAKGRRIGRPVLDRLFTGGMSLAASAALGARLTDINAQPKLFGRQLLAKLGDAPGDFSLDLYLLWRARQDGFAIVEHPVRFGVRTQGEAKGGGTLPLKWKLTRRTLAFILDLRRRVRNEARRGA